MPQVARIGALIFQIFQEIGERHHLKHVKVIYGDDNATFDLNNGNLISGYLKPPQMRTVAKALQNVHNRLELIKCWDLLNQEDVREPVTQVNLRMK